jgi:hypothetical protein
MVAMDVQEVQQAGDLEDPYGPPLGPVNGESPSLFAQTALGVNQGGDTRTVDEGESGEVEHDLLGPLLDNFTEHPGQFRGSGHVQFTGEEDDAVAVESHDLGRESFCRRAHMSPNPKVLQSESTQFLLVTRLAACGPVFSRRS